MKRSKAFTLVELLVVVAIIALLVSILVPTLTRARELAKRALCQANLNGMGKALELYYAESKGAFPMIKSAANDSGTGLAFNGNPDIDDDVYNLAGTFPQDNLSLLVYKGLLGWDMFLCPSSTNKIKDRSSTGDDFGFGGDAGESYCDYGLQIPQHYVSGGTEHKAYLYPSAHGALVIVADRPPDPGKLVTEFSPNHGDEGDCILHFGGNVKWADDERTTNPAYKNACGWGKNNIFTKDMTAQDAVQAGDPTAPTATVSKYDSVLYWDDN